MDAINIKIGNQLAKLKREDIASWKDLAGDGQFTG